MDPAGICVCVCACDIDELMKHENEGTMEVILNIKRHATWTWIRLCLFLSFSEGIRIKLKGDILECESFLKSLMSFSGINTFHTKIETF